MGTDRTQLYLPWTDDALIPGESGYALLNKLAWYSNRGPLQPVRDLEATEDICQGLGSKLWEVLRDAEAG